MSFRPGFIIRCAYLGAVLLLPCVAAAQTYELVHSFGPAGLATPVGSLALAQDGTLFGVMLSGGLLSRGSLFALAPDGLGGFAFAELHSFTGPDGLDPWDGLLLAADGSLLGTTGSGGADVGGTVFRVTASGHLTTLHSFSFPDGALPRTGVAAAPDGSLWGTTDAGGSSNNGTVYRTLPSGETTIVHFFGYVDGSSPRCRLLLASDGNFYGTTVLGGANEHGTIFRLEPSGTVTTIHDFTMAEGGYSTTLTEGSPGVLYGVTAYGGASNWGTVFTIDFAGTYSVIHEFDGTDGIQPQTRLVPASAGGFYGTTSDGGPDVSGAGTVFHLSEAGAVTTLHAFNYTSGGFNPSLEIVEAPDGSLYGGTAGGGAYGAGTVFRIDPIAGFATIWTFEAKSPVNPYSGLIRASDGSLYGTTAYAAQSDGGAIYKLDAQDHVSVLRYLTAAEGVNLQGNLFEAASGDLYGMASGSGSVGRGTLFKITPGGAFTLLRAFAGDEAGTPLGGFSDGGDGFLYGAESGSGDAGDLFGEIFRIDLDGNFSTVHAFDGADGAFPVAPPIRASNGALYGTASGGGANPPYGTVFRIDSGTLTTLHDFARTDGAVPWGLLEASDGNLYGTAFIGGTHDNGTVFKVDSLDAVSTLHDFFAEAIPTSLMQATDGNLYGTAVGGAGYGTVFRMDLSGNTTVLHTFSGVDGISPYGRLLETDDGLLGTAVNGGLTSSGGVLYRILLTPHDPAVESLEPSSGRAAGGASLEIRGTHFQLSPTVTVGGIPVVGTAVEIDSRTIRIVAPAFTPGTLQDVTVTNIDASTATLAGAWFTDFLDVDTLHPFHDFVESIVRAGITAGCGGGNYCGAAPVTRAQMAVFLLKAKHGSDFVPPACTGLFDDVACPGAFAVDWIEDLSLEGITGGCGGANYCPNNPVRRDQMAVFLLKASQGSTYVPPPATGTVFTDVPASAFAADWIEDLYSRNVTGGCLTNPLRYCPTNTNNRQQMAVFITKTFGLQ